MWPFILFVFLFITPSASAQAIDWSGTWDSRWRDGGATLYLEQDGDIVTGTYPAFEGTIRGEVRGRLLVGSWTQPTGAGDFVFAQAPDGRSFSGRFGTGEWWTGERFPVAPADNRVRADASSPRTALLSFIAAGNAARGDRIDRLAAALNVLDFTDLPAERAETPTDRLRPGQAAVRHPGSADVPGLGGADPGPGRTRGRGPAAPGRHRRNVPPALSLRRPSGRRRGLVPGHARAGGHGAHPRSAVGVSRRCAAARSCAPRPGLAARHHADLSGGVL